MIWVGCEIFAETANNSDYYVGKLHINELRYYFGCGIDLITDFAGTEENTFKIIGAFMNYGGEALFHTYGRTASVDVACKGQQFL